MPLPDADNPKTSNLYAQLRTSQLESIDTDNFEKVKHPVYVNADNEDEARRLKLWGELGGQSSSSGPFLGTGVIQRQAFSAGTTGWATVWRPDEGQVWVVQSAMASPQSGNVSLSMSYYSTVSNTRCLLDAGTGTVTADTLIDMVNGPTYVSNEMYLQTYISTNVGGVTLSLVVSRVR